MYEEKKGTNFLIGDIIIKLITFFLIFFALFIVFYSIKQLSKTNNETSLYSENLNNMKTAAFEHYTSNKLPIKVGESKTVSLGDMVDQKLLYDFTENGKNCDLQNSFVKATKTSDENYALKVLLSCKEKEDYLVTTIEKKADCLDCKEVIKEVIKEELKDKEIVNKNTENKGKVTETNKTNNKSSTTTSSGSTNKQTSTQNVTKTVIIKNYYSQTNITIPCEGCTSVKPEVKPEPPKKVKWYKHEIKSKELHYDYCLTKTCEYYTTSWVSTDRLQNYTYTLKIKDSYLFKDEHIKLYSHSYFRTSLIDYKNYLNNRSIDLEVVNNNTYYNVYNINEYQLRDSSLTRDNFTYNISNPYKKGNYYYVDVTIRIKNFNNVSPFYFSNAGKNIYFVPFKFSVSHLEDKYCFSDKSSNKLYYQGYIYTNPHYKYTSSYKWTTSINEPNMTYTGIWEYR